MCHPHYSQRTLNCLTAILSSVVIVLTMINKDDVITMSN